MRREDRGWRRQETGDRRQEAGDRRQEAGGRSSIHIREERGERRGKRKESESRLSFQNALISKGIISNRQAEKTESSFHTLFLHPDLD